MSQRPSRRHSTSRRDRGKHRLFRSIYSWLRFATHQLRWQTDRFQSAFLQALGAATRTGFRLRYCWGSRHFWFGLPAFVAGAAIVTLLGLAWAVPRDDLAARYGQEGERLTAAGDYRAGRTCCQRAVALGDERPNTRYCLAVCLARIGQPGQATAIMRRLAGAEPGYSRAELWLARRFLERPEPGPEEEQEAERHLLRALELEPELIEAEVTLAELYTRQGRFADAEKHWLHAATVKRDLELVLAGLYAAQKDQPRTSLHAVKAQDWFGERLRAAPDDTAALLGYARACLYQQKHAEAVAVLKKGLRDREDTAVRNSLGDAYASWVRALERTPDTRLAERLRLLEEGLHYAPTNRSLLTYLVDFSNRTGAEADRARSLLQHMLVEKRPSGLVHLLLGLVAWRRGQSEAARVHLEQAHTLDPEMALISNDLAWILANSPKPDLACALSLADDAVKRWPRQPNVRDTRGEILVKLGRWREAVADLEQAQAGMPDNPGVHHALATAYEHLGMTELAEMHRRRAEACTVAHTNPGPTLPHRTN